MDETYGPFDLRLAPCTTLQIIGKSHMGKTTLSCQIALKRNLVYQNPPEKWRGFIYIMNDTLSYKLFVINGDTITNETKQ